MRLFVLLLATWLLCACGDDDARSTGDGGMVEVPLDGQASSGNDASTMFEPPREPRTFRIGFGELYCQGDCPSYGLSLYEDGRVSFAGDRCVARPGVYVRSATRADSRAVYDALVAAGYFGLEDSYLSPAHGCPSTNVREPVMSWVVEVDGRRKEVARARACRLPALESVEQLMIERAGVRPWIEPLVPGCGTLEGGGARDFAGSYRLASAVATIGILTLTRDDRSWLLSDCAGRMLSAGRISFEAERWLLGARPAGPLVLPSVSEKLGAIWISGTPEAPSARAPHYEGEGESALVLVPQSGC